MSYQEILESISNMEAGSSIYKYLTYLLNAQQFLTFPKNFCEILETNSIFKK